MKKEKLNTRTGLFATQEKAATMLIVQGKSVQECAEELKIDPDNIQAWQQKANFEAYCNQLILDMKRHSSRKIIGLYNRALEVITDCLDSQNDNVRFRTAQFLIEKMEEKIVGQVDARIIIKEQCTTNPMKEWEPGEQFDNEKYEKLCRENNLD